MSTQLQLNKEKENPDLSKHSKVGGDNEPHSTAGSTAITGGSNTLHAGSAALHTGSSTSATSTLSAPGMFSSVKTTSYEVYEDPPHSTGNL